MEKKVYTTPDLEGSYLCEPNVLLASGGNDTLIDDNNIWDYDNALIVGGGIES